MKHHVFREKWAQGFGPFAARGVAVVLAVVAPVHAAPLGAQQGPDATQVTIELNKLEAYDKGCRAYMVVNNPSSSTYQSLKLDLVLFQPDGVIGRRFAIDLAPVKPTKKSVKLFDIEGIGCDKVASVLVNDVMECKADTGVFVDCLSRMSFSSVAPAPLTTK